MSINKEKLNSLVNSELQHVSDERVINHIREKLVSSVVIMRPWDYGEAGAEYPCWSILNDINSNTGICYSEYGFGPMFQWGLVSLTGPRNDMSMGMDSGWFPNLMEAYFDSMASDLDIWRVFKSDNGDYPGNAVSAESDWDSIWKEVYRLRESNNSSSYYCHHSIEYKRSGY